MTGTGPFAGWRWTSLFEDIDQFLAAWLTTIEVAALALVLALILGVIFGLMSTSQNKILRGISRVYVEFFQNTPLVVQIFFYYNALPYASLVMSTFLIGVLGVGIYHGAYISDVVRTGILSIPKGQMEAAHSQGFTTLQAMRYIILPQTIKIILPPLVNQAVMLIKNTSILAMIAGGDMMYRANSWSTQGTLSYGPAYVICGVSYFIICFPLAKWARYYEEKIKRNDVRKSDNEEEAPAKEVA